MARPLWKVKFVEHWVNDLRLNEWTIKWKEVNGEPMGRTEAIAATRYFPLYREAFIEIQKGRSRQNWKRDMLHELLHLRFPIIKKLYHEDDERFEVGMEVMARILLGEFKGGG